MMNNCNFCIKHDIISFKEFYHVYLNNNLNEYNMNHKKYKSYYIKSIYIYNEITIIDNIYIKFKNNFKIILKLNKVDTSQIKHLVLGDLNTLKFEDILKNLVT